MFENTGVLGWGIQIPARLIPVMAFIGIWSLFWKGLALWHSGRRVEPWWFVIMLIINTFGILEIIYLFGVAKLKFENLFKKNA